MGRELSHVEAVELLGAYALDALEADERGAVERHALHCPSCTAEVVDHREVAGLLTPGWAKPPPGVWERIAASLEEVPPPLDLAPVIAMKPGQERRTAPAPAPSSATGSGSWGARRRSLVTGIAAMVAVAAATVIGLLGFRVADDNRRFADLAIGDPVAQLERSANAALAAPEATRVALRSDDGARTAEAVVLPDGTGYLVRSNLPPLSADKTYQLWAIIGNSKISVGVLGGEARVSSFRMDGDVSALAITEEARGGVERTTKNPVVVGRVDLA